LTDQQVGGAPERIPPESAGLSTVRDADLILVMDHGRLVEHGTHRQVKTAGAARPDLPKAQFARREQETRPKGPEQ
jgi:ATP-binding cassette subfamily B multidrug efflux pump